MYFKLIKWADWATRPNNGMFTVNEMPTVERLHLFVDCYFNKSNGSRFLAFFHLFDA
jgi:hypothetical protein